MHSTSRTIYGVKTKEYMKVYNAVCKCLLDIPLDKSLIGYTFIKDAITLTIINGEDKINLLKEVLLPISERHNVSVKEVDKSIRYTLNSVNHFYNKIDESFYPNHAIALAAIEAKPKLFIVVISEYVKSKYNKILKLKCVRVNNF